MLILSGKMTSNMTKLTNNLFCTIALLAASLLSAVLALPAMAQDQYDQNDPPSRVARLGYLQGAVSFQPAGESEWVEAAHNRPLTTGDKLWADQDSRAELNLGSAVIDLNGNSGISFLNLDDRTAQIQLSSGVINLRVRQLDRDEVFEIDTPNQAFSIFRPGRYRVEASEDGTYTVVSIREGEGESTGNGQSYTVHAGQRATFEGADRLNAQVEQLGYPDDFDNWCEARYRRYEDSRSARYVSHDVVGYEDLDDNGDWRPEPSYGNVWFPHVYAGWAPYREGHWAWIDPWGWTWVDDEPWGYAPFHYGRWCSIGGRWGWVPGPVEVRPVYAPALVVFVGLGAVGGNVGWFPLGPREVYVPSYRVSRGYVDRVNISNTTVNQTTVTNVYNTTIINNNTTINNVSYVNRNVSGAVVAVPQRAFASAQPVSRAAVAVNPREVAGASMNARAAVAPTASSVLGVHADTANRVKAPPAAVASRPVVAKAQVPPPPPPFAARQRVLAEHPGQPIPRQEMQRFRPANNVGAGAAPPPVRQAPPGRPAEATVAQPGSPPARGTMGRSSNQPAPNERPAANPAQPYRGPVPNNQPARNDRPPTAEPNNRPEPNRPEPNQPQPNNRPQPNQPAPNYRPQPNQPQPNNRPAEPPPRNDRPPAAQPNNRPESNQPAPNYRPQPNQPQPNNRPAEPPMRNDRPPAAQPNNRPEPNQPAPNYRPQPNQPQPNNRPAEPPMRNERPPEAQPRPEQTQPQQYNRPQPNQAPPNYRQTEPPSHPAPAARPASPPPSERQPQRTPPPQETRPAQPQPHSQPPADQKKPDKPQNH
jgi:hypothetical protein